MVVDGGLVSGFLIKISYGLEVRVGEKCLKHV